MGDIIEKQEGIFEFVSPQRINAETWLNEHLDCDAIIDNGGDYFTVYAFTLDPKYNYALDDYRANNFTNQHILRGISSAGLNSLF